MRCAMFSTGDMVCWVWFRGGFSLRLTDLGNERRRHANSCTPERGRTHIRTAHCTANSNHNAQINVDIAPQIDATPFSLSLRLSPDTT
eukprot:2630804-Rhodomonas_salina.4